MCTPGRSKPVQKFKGSKCVPFIGKSETHTHTLKPTIYRINPKIPPLPPTPENVTF